MLRLYKTSTTFYIITALSLMLFACSSSTSSDSDSNFAVIQGSVSESSGESSTMLHNTQGTVITAARITSDGSFSTIEGVQTQTNASGNFTLELDVREASHIAIMAETASGTKTGFLSTRVQNGQTYTLKPISVESSAQTAVYARVVASGKSNIVQKADIETAVSTQAAAAIHGNSTLATQIATGLANAAEARAAFVVDFASGNATQILSSAADARAEAQVAFEAALHAGATGSQKEAAFDAFIEAGVNAYVTAGMNASAVAKMTHMYKEVFLNSTSTVSATVRNQVRARTAMAASVAIDSAVRAEASASGLSQATVQVIANAGTELRSSIKASSGVTAEIKAAFEAYHEQVREAMESDASVEAAVIIAIDTEINALGGSKAIFNTAISGAINANTVVQIYKTFANSVLATVESHFSNSTELNAEAMARLMLLINLAS
jgi:hypothetical protein